MQDQQHPTNEEGRDLVSVTNEAPASNGSAETTPEAVRLLREMIATRRTRAELLRAQLAEIEPELKRYERALALILDEPPPPGPGRGRPPGGGKATRDKPSGLSAERLARVEEAVRNYAAEHDEFRQVDIRTVIDVTSGVTALAFEDLRQKGIIRLARAEGNNKWFRLTREALREGSEG